MFTNLSQDHLDYHKSMRNYLKMQIDFISRYIKKNKSIISDNTLKEYNLLKKISKIKKLRFIEINSIERKLKNNLDLNLTEFQLKNLAMAMAAAKLCQLKEKYLKIIK